MRHLVLVAVLCTALTISLAGSAAAAEPSPGTTFAGTGDQGQLHVSVKVNRFIATAAGTKAAGTATATLDSAGSAPVTVSKQVTLAASSSGQCTILTLTLETLELKLLGLDVHLEKVVLNVTGERHGGVLGSLFCSLAGAKAKAARAAAVKRLNTAIQRDGLVEPVGFVAGVRATVAEAAAPTCSVLNLVLGPLHLDLLGLVVNLNQVHLTVTAEPTGGALGSLFCSLAAAKLG